MKKNKIIELYIFKQKGLELGIPEVLRNFRDPLFDLYDNPKVIVEIGSQQGWFAWRVCKFCPNAKVYCVDPWLNSPDTGNGEFNLKCWKKNLAEYNGTRAFALHGTSIGIAPTFNETIDILFIDGDHSFNSVLTDLKLWVPKVRKPGGIVSGHDYGTKAGHAGRNVQRAINIFRPNKKINIGYFYRYVGQKEVPSFWWRQ